MNSNRIDEINRQILKNSFKNPNLINVNQLNKEQISKCKLIFNILF
jgi:hypothetical protein